MKLCYQITVGILVLAISFANALATEKAVTMKDLPAPVQRTVEGESQGATIRGLTKEVEGGKTLYEVEMTVNGHGKDVTIDGFGAVIEVEEEVALESIPGPARVAFEKAAGSGKITKVERVTRGKQTSYEAQLRKDGKRSETKVSADGRLLPAD